MKYLFCILPYCLLYLFCKAFYDVRADVLPYLCIVKRKQPENKKQKINHMKKVILTAVTIAAFVFTSFAADNVANKTLTVQSKARIITPITLANTGSQALDFGVIARGTTGSSTILVGSVASPSITVTGDAIVLTSAPQTAAKFTVTGESAKTYAITIPSTTQTITDGTNILNITAFTCSNGAIGTIGTGDVFYVGGTLTTTSTTVAGTYAGTFNVTVAYN